MAGNGRSGKASPRGKFTARKRRLCSASACGQAPRSSSRRWRSAWRRRVQRLPAGNSCRGEPAAIPPPGRFPRQAACGHFIDPFLLLLGLTLLFLQRASAAARMSGGRGDSGPCRGGGNRRARRAVASAARPVRPAWGVAEIIGGQGGESNSPGARIPTGTAGPAPRRRRRLAHQRGGFRRGECEQRVGALILLRLPDSDSTCRLASVSDRMLPA